MNSDDHYTPIDKKRTFLQTWTGKAIVVGASSALLGGGYYYLQSSDQAVSSKTMAYSPKSSFSSRRTLKDQTNLQSAEEGAADSAAGEDSSAGESGNNTSNDLADFCNGGGNGTTVLYSPQDTRFRLVVDPIMADSHCKYGNPLGGRPEYYDGYVWGTICDDFFDQSNTGAQVFCRSMGLPSSDPWSYRLVDFGGLQTAYGPINMDDVNCQGWESDLTQCSWASYHNCGHSEDTGVVCFGNYTTGEEWTNNTSDSEKNWSDVNDSSWSNNTSGWDYNNTTTDGWDYSNNTSGCDHCDADTTDGHSGWTNNSSDTNNTTGWNNSSNDNTTGWTNSSDGNSTSWGGHTFYSPNGYFRLIENPHSMTEYYDAYGEYPSKVQGRIEVYDGYEWGTVCDDLFGAEEAQVFCSSLGLPKTGAQVIFGLWETVYDRPILMDNVECTGDESYLTECSFTSDHNCGHSEDVGVLCVDLEPNTTAPKMIEVASSRLVLNPEVPAEWTDDSYTNVTFAVGRVEYLGWNGASFEWGSVCDDGFTDESAKVFCRSLGLPFTDARAIPEYGGETGHQGHGNITMDNVECSGYEYNLTECSWTSDHNCGHKEDVGVVCQGNVSEPEEWTDDSANGTLTVGNFRLVGPTNPVLEQNVTYSGVYEGRPEFYNGYEWGTICDDNFNDLAAQIFCSSMGLPSCNAYQIQSYGSYGNEGYGSINMDDVSCHGYFNNSSNSNSTSSNSLEGCYWTPHHNCGHGEDVGVVCQC